jgi:hypothetical protein
MADFTTHVSPRDVTPGKCEFPYSLLAVWAGSRLRATLLQRTHWASQTRPVGG